MRKMPLFIVVLIALLGSASIAFACGSCDKPECKKSEKIECSKKDHSKCDKVKCSKVTCDKTPEECAKAKKDCTKKECPKSAMKEDEKPKCHRGTAQEKAEGVL
ncbi:MAG: hypothetical protein OCC49_00225 [Fibrobacterales bacterium]